ncbi:MAG TPA: hypothetical protein VF092_01765 [Longimicrobium sp.]
MRSCVKEMGSAALALALAACANPRAKAVAELERLQTEMDRHAAAYGRYPATIDTRRPAAAENLPYAPSEGITVYLLTSDTRGYQAVATRRPWSCSLVFVRGEGQRVECNPNATSANIRADTAESRRVFNGVLSPGADSAK